MHVTPPSNRPARPAGPTPTRSGPAVRAEVPDPTVGRSPAADPSPHAVPPSGEGVDLPPDLAEGEFRRRLTDLLAEIGTLPADERERIEKLADDARRRDEQMRSTVAGLQESLDYLRLSVKYLVFDLEATRRENRYLRKMVDEAGGDD